MKKILLFLSVIALTWTACTPDDNSGGGGNNGPVLTTNSGIGFAQDGDTLRLLPKDTFRLSISGVKGTTSLKHISIFENGANVPVARINLDGTAAAANPSLLFNEEKDGLSNYIISIKTQDTPTVATYKVVLTDEGGLSDEVSVYVITKVGIRSSDPVILYNYSGPNPGGLDLINSKQVPSASASAHIRDFGNISGSWGKRYFQQNGTQIRVPAAGFDLTKLKFSDEISTAYNAGTDTPNGDIAFNVNTVFLAKNGNSYFVCKVLRVFETASDNLDYSEIVIYR